MVAGTGVEESVRGRRSRSENYSIDDVVKSFDTSTLDSNDPWGSVRTCDELVYRLDMPSGLRVLTRLIR